MWINDHGIVTQEGSGIPALALRAIATDELPIYNRFSLAIVDKSEASLTERAVKALTLNRAHRVSGVYEETGTRYVLRACVYHVERMAIYYAEQTQRFESSQARRESSGKARAIRGQVSDHRIYYEADAFLTAARRFYEQLRQIVWKHFPTDGSRPRSFESVLDASAAPEEYRERLRASWSEHGVRLKDYRDSLAHYDPFTPGGEPAWLEQFAERWGLVVRLPANPEAQSRRSYRFEDGPDALSYCHDVLCHITDMAELTHTTIGLDDPEEFPFGRINEP